MTALELIDPEETPKNVMIKAIKRDKPDEKKQREARAEYEKAIAFLGVKPYFNELLENGEDTK